jgi:hypothetical protein
VQPIDVAPGGTATLSYGYMPGPATCTVAIDYPGSGSASLPAQTATYNPAGNYGMSWTFTVPAGTPAGGATTTGTCTYPGTTLAPAVIGFNIIP